MTSYQEDFQYLLEYAEDDWMPISTVSAVAASHADAHASFAKKVDTLVTIVGELIDHGALPGEIIANDPGFAPWVGSREQLLDRFRSEVVALGRLPDIGEICWIHIPDGNR